jgi:hypothetical protein
MSRRVIILGLVSLVCVSGFLSILLLPDPERPRILLYGDSMCSTSGEFAPAMHQAFANAEVIADGRVGAPSPRLAAAFAAAPAWVAPPDLVFVIMGANNPAWAPNDTPERAWIDFATIRKTAQAAGVPIFLGTPLPATQGVLHGHPCDERWRTPFLRRVHDLVLEQAGADAIDFDEAVPQAEASVLISDCLHPNAEAAKRMAAVVHRIVCQQRYRREFARVCGRLDWRLKGAAMKLMRWWASTKARRDLPAHQ